MGHGRREIVAQLRRHGEELLRHDAAHGVDAEVLGRGVAAAVAEEAGDGIVAAVFDRLTEDVLLHEGLLSL
jgi:hypothetical protein